MLKLLTATVVSGLFLSLGLPSQAQRLPPPPVQPPLPSPSSISVPSSSVGPSLGLGDAGSDVQALQEALARNGFDPGPIDGAYGPMTQLAVEEFQRVYDLSVTGIAGPQTFDILGLNPNSVNVVVVGNEDSNGQDEDTRYVAAITESTSNLEQVRRSFGNAAIDYARSGEFINIGQYNRHSEAADRVREARRLGFEARVIYQR